MGMSQMCTGADHYFRPSKPHSGKLCVINVKALVGAFNQEKALVGAFSVIVQFHRWIDVRARVTIVRTRHGTSLRQDK